MPALPLFSALLMALYLSAFFVMTARAAKAAGRSVWLFGAGPDQGTPALLFRAGFAGGLLYPLLLAVGVEPVSEILVPPESVRLAGLAVAFAGAAFAIHAQNYMALPGE